jgi:hypothetical protein
MAASPEPALAAGIDEFPEPLLQSRHASKGTATISILTTSPTPLVVNWWSNP